MKKIMVLMTATVALAFLFGCKNENHVKKDNNSSVEVFFDVTGCDSVIFHHFKIFTQDSGSKKQVVFITDTINNQFISDKKHIILDCGCEPPKDEEFVITGHSHQLDMRSLQLPCGVTNSPLDSIIMKLRPCDNPVAKDFLKKNRITHDIFGNDIRHFLKE